MATTPLGGIAARLALKLNFCSVTTQAVLTTDFKTVRVCGYGSGRHR